MSDLAPFVAALLRDRIVAEMLEENKQLRKQLSYSRKIEVVVDHKHVDNKSDTVILAKGHLDQGYYDIGSKPNSKPKFTVNFTKTFGCPLRVVGKAQVRMGGICLENLGPSSSEAVVRCDLTQTPWLDSHTTKGVILRSGDISLTLIVYGWPWGDWSTVLRNVLDGWDEPNQLVNYLLHVLPRKYPHARVAFQSVQLSPEKYKGPIGNLPKVSSRHEAATRRKNRKGQEIISL